jgi:hypothetical protein
MDEADWAINEFGAAVLGDRRRTDRLIQVATVLGQRPGASIPAACDDLAMRKGAYRLLENAAVAPAAILASHVQATWERVASLPVVLAAQDTTELDFTGHLATTGLGPLRHGRERGLLAHTTLAVTPEGLPLGVLAQEVWARPERDKPVTSSKRPPTERESQKWFTSLRAVGAGREAAPQTTIISVGDREADIYDLFLVERPKRVELLVRAQHDRWVRVATDAQQYIHALWTSLGTAPIAGERQVAVPRRPGQRARVATLTVRWQAVVLVPPPQKKQLPPVPVWAVRTTEYDPPPDVEPLDWLLLTTLPISTFADAQERIDWYVCRWTIEVWHRVLKSGCALEQRQLASAENLQRGLALYSVIAWRVLAATLLARAVPDLPCTILLEAAEWQALYCAIHGTTAPPAAPPSLGEAVRWLAKLGGYMGRRRDGPPGPEVLWRGLQRLVDLTLMYHVFSPPSSRPKCG